jgi:hypothetical protein
MHESVIFTDDNDEKMCMMRGKIRRNRIRFSQYLNKITFLKIKVSVASSPLFFTESIFRGGQDSISNETHRLVELKKKSVRQQGKGRLLFVFAVSHSSH